MFKNIKRIGELDLSFAAFYIDNKEVFEEEFWDKLDIHILEEEILSSLRYFKIVAFAIECFISHEPIIVDEYKFEIKY